MFAVSETPLKGCFEIQPIIRSDDRGCFVKTFHFDEFKSLGLEGEFKEEYFSRSRGGVVRGLHFQEPNMDHTKVIYCIHGSVFDVVIDLRLNSKTYGKTYSLELSEEKANMLYVPSGFAHGFAAMADAVMIYKASTVYSAEHDKGILWNSAGIEWPISRPVISVRDSSFPTFAEFKTPFTYDGIS